jgi:glycosyltransferase involved in cell wall biosynthesis
MTVYNLEAFVAEAIESVLKQSVRPDRFVVVNDGSSDKSLEVMMGYSRDITIIDNKKNVGVLQSVLEAIEKLDTDIVALIDGDDRWDREKLSNVRDVFASDDHVMFSTHSFRRIDRNGNLLAGDDITLTNLDRIKRKAAGNMEEMDLLLKESILSYKGVWLGSALSFRRNCFDIKSFRKFSESIWGHDLSHQDQPIAYYMILANPDGRIRYIDKVLFDYRIFGENSSGSSASPARALRTLSRSKATLLRTKDLVEKMPRKHELRRQIGKIREIDYLENLYKKNYRLAAGNFVELFFSFWNWRERTKETVRFVGVLIFGPDRFLKYK